MFDNTTIWDDINNDTDVIVISNINYNPTSLSNSTYEVIDNRKQKRALTRKNKQLHDDYESIIQHKHQIDNDDDIDLLIKILFKQDELANISSLDKVFLNCYYRKLLRSKLERDFIGKELLPGLIITSYSNYLIDQMIVLTLRYFRIICNYLGIPSTTDSAVFSIDKLYMPSFWSSMSEKFVHVFGETLINPIEFNRFQHDIIPNNIGSDKSDDQIQVFVFLNTIFYVWSGSGLILLNNPEIQDETNIMVKVVPATYITRMLPKLK